MNLKPAVLLPVAACAILLAGCSSSDSSDSAAAASSSGVDFSTTMPDVPSGDCPTTKPADNTPAQWEVTGTSGKVAITGQTDTTAPRIDVTTPFTVDETQVKTLTPGTGAEVTKESTVSVCYMGVDGRDGETFDSSYDANRGQSAQFPAMGVVPGFRQALIGQKVGSTVGVVIPSKDGYPDGSGSILPGDSIIFALKILAAE